VGGWLGKHLWHLDISGGWMDPRAGLDMVVKKKSLPMLGIESLAIQPIGSNLRLSLRSRFDSRRYQIF
jgi:hypothetical protein